MKIVIPGGSGQVGAVLERAFFADGHDVVILTRRSNRASCKGSRLVGWDGKTLGPWAKELDGADVVINLAGYTVNCRYHQRNRERIMNSRVDSTRVVGEAIRNASHPPAVWLQASTATIYAHTLDPANDEANGIIGGHEKGVPETWKFSIDVAQAWERAFDEVELPHTRKVKLRSAMVMSPDRGGIFDVLLGLVRWGLGGRSGDGRQFVSWVHHEDFVRAIKFLIARSDLDGVINIASPNPLSNADFMRAIRRACGKRFGLPATRWMLAIGAMLMRTETELILKSRRVIPTRLVDAGFAFNHPDWREAARDLVKAYRLGAGQTPNR
ncbi:MAG TPA: TIGR01777 family oxidoreductase [Phycisphaerae bacterium]|nr:TIGR01777 family oxidoreductase [Phycisphaerae bacterium]